MKKILFTLVFTLFYLPLCGFSQSDIHTPNKSEPAAFKLAKVYFLPDWSDKVRAALSVTAAKLRDIR